MWPWFPGLHNRIEIMLKALHVYNKFSYKNIALNSCFFWECEIQSVLFFIISNCSCKPLSLEIFSNLLEKLFCLNFRNMAMLATTGCLKNDPKELFFHNIWMCWTFYDSCCMAIVLKPNLSLHRIGKKVTKVFHNVCWKKYVKINNLDLFL